MTLTGYAVSAPFLTALDKLDLLRSVRSPVSRLVVLGPPVSWEQRQVAYSMARGAFGDVGMPRKIRQLKSDLRKAGFLLVPRRGKGSHTVWVHPVSKTSVTVSGSDSDDAQF